MKLVKAESFHLHPQDENIDKLVNYESYIRKVKDNYPNQNTEIEVVEHDYSYFACTCSSEDEKYWKQRLYDYLPDFDPDVHASLVSQLCAEITHGFNGSVCGIDMDMWFGVSVKGTIHLADNKFENYNIYMQCDDVTLGLMAVVDILKTIFVSE